MKKHFIRYAIAQLLKQRNNKTFDFDDAKLSTMIDQYFEENLVGKFTDNDTELVKEVIRDFIKNYLFHK